MISSGTDLIAADRTTIANPVCIHTRMTIKRRLFHGCCWIQGTGSLPSPIMIPFNNPMLVPNPSGRKLYMKRQTTAAPMNEIAIGRKIIDLATASPWRSRSASVAKTRPMLTPNNGTMMIQPRVLRIERSMLGSEKTNL